MKLKYLALCLTALSLLAAGCGKQAVKQNNGDRKEGEAMVQKESMENKEGSMADKEKGMMSGAMQKENSATPTTDSMMKKTASMMQKAGSYLDYSEQAVAEAQKNGKKVVLFFHAAWCPYCKAADAAFKANPDKIPAEVVLLKTDYDSQTALKQKYGVTYQHTFVQIDNSGNMLTKWVSGDVDLLNKNVK